MTERRLWVFFYGSFIDVAVLKRFGMVPDSVEVVTLNGFDISIGPLATIVAKDRGTVYGILVKVTPDEVANLYAHDWVSAYRPEAVLVETNDGRTVAALCYVAPEPDDPRRPADEYLDRIESAARGLEFPESYIAMLEGFRNR